jgi:hypothetical protein
MRRPTEWMLADGTEPVIWWSDVGSDGEPPCYMVLTTGFQVPGRSVGTVQFAAAPPQRIAKELADMDEHDLTSAVLHNKDILWRVISPLVEPGRDYWLAVELRRRDLRGVAQQGRPGDIDIALGHMTDGKPSFAHIVGVEIKVRKASGTGVGQGALSAAEQAKGLFVLGCNQAVLLVMVVGRQDEISPLAPGAIGTLFGRDLSPTANATMRHMVPLLHDKLGYMVCTWGHPPDNAPLSRNAVCVYPLIRPSRQHGMELHDDWARANRNLQQALMDIWNTVDPPDHRVRCCHECWQVVPFYKKHPDRCPGCGEFWVLPIDHPTVLNVRPIAD